MSESIDERAKKQDPEAYKANVEQYPDVDNYAAGATGDEHSPVGSQSSYAFGATIPEKEKANEAAAKAKEAKSKKEQDKGSPNAKEEIEVTDEGAKKPKRN